MSSIELTASELAASFELAADPVDESTAGLSAELTGVETATVEEDDPPNPVLPTGNEILWSAVFFLLFWMLMKYVLLPPIRAIQKKRSEHIESGKDTVAGTAEEKAKLMREHDEALGASRREASEIVEAARQRAETHRLQIISEAEAVINQKREQEEVSLEAARQKALSSLRGDVEDLTSRAAGLVLGEDPDKKLVSSQVGDQTKGDQPKQAEAESEEDSK